MTLIRPGSQLVEEPGLGFMPLDIYLVSGYFSIGHLPWAHHLGSLNSPGGGLLWTGGEAGLPHGKPGGSN